MRSLVRRLDVTGRKRQVLTLRRHGWLGLTDNCKGLSQTRRKLWRQQTKLATLHSRGGRFTDWLLSMRSCASTRRQKNGAKRVLKSQNSFLPIQQGKCL